MSDLPTLIVIGAQADQILDAQCDHANCDEFHVAESATVRIDGPLPPVWGGTAELSRPLRVGDRVRLATQTYVELAPKGRGNWRKERWPFATATVARIDEMTDILGNHWCWGVTVTEIVAL